MADDAEAQRAELRRQRNYERVITRGKARDRQQRYEDERAADIAAMNRIARRANRTGKSLGGRGTGYLCEAGVGACQCLCCIPCIYKLRDCTHADTEKRRRHAEADAYDSQYYSSDEDDGIAGGDCAGPSSKYMTRQQMLEESEETEKLRERGLRNVTFDGEGALGLGFRYDEERKLFIVVAVAGQAKARRVRVGDVIMRVGDRSVDGLTCQINALAASEKGDGWTPWVPPTTTKELAAMIRAERSLGNVTIQLKSESHVPLIDGSVPTIACSDSDKADQGLSRPLLD